MDLFHLTATGQDVIDAIEEEGLRPGPDGWDNWSPAADLAAGLIGDVVWLIDDPTFKQCEGIIYSDGSSWLWRVVCTIPAQDPNLIRFRDCLLPSVKLNHFMDHIWVYAGVVEPSRIKAIEFLGIIQSNWEWGEGTKSPGDEDLLHELVHDIILDISSLAGPNASSADVREGVWKAIRNNKEYVRKEYLRAVFDDWFSNRYG
jgi:hypothetical protein